MARTKVIALDAPELAGRTDIRAIVYSEDHTQASTGSAWENFTAGNIGTYKISLTDVTGRGHFRGDLPAHIDQPGYYPIEAVENATNTHISNWTLAFTGEGLPTVLAGEIIAELVALISVPLGGVAAPGELGGFILRGTEAGQLEPVGFPGGYVQLAGLHQTISDFLRGVLTSGTTQAGGSGATAVLANTAGALDGVYVGCLVAIGTEHRTIVAYNGTTKTATLNKALAAENEGAAKTYTIFRHVLPATDSSGRVSIDLAPIVPESNTANSVGDCLNAARGQGFGPWTKNGTSLIVKGPSGNAIRTFTLDDADEPTSRT